MSGFAKAEAVFGSASRGDNDALSDRDILIVDTDIHLLNRRQAALEASGWSVASYTFAKLNALVRKGALFGSGAPASRVRTTFGMRSFE